MIQFTTSLLVRKKKWFVFALWVIVFSLGYTMIITGCGLMGQSEIERIYDFSQLNNIGLFQMFADLSPYESDEFQADWIDAWGQVEGLDGIKEIWIQQRMWTEEIEEVVLSSANMLKRMPLELSEGEWPVWIMDSDSTYPIILDYRLRDQYRIGDVIELELNTRIRFGVAKQMVKVAGFLTRNNGNIALTYGRSDLHRLSQYVQTYPESVIGLTVLPEILDIYPESQGRYALLVSEDATSGLDAIQEWDRILTRHGIGEVWSMDFLYKEEAAFRKQWVPGFISFNATLILLLGISISGFVSLLLYQKRRTLAVLNLLGLNRCQWLRSMGIIQCILVWPGVVGGVLAFKTRFLYPTDSLVPFFFLMVMLLLFLSAIHLCLFISWGKIQPLELFKEANE